MNERWRESREGEPGSGDVWELHGREFAHDAHTYFVLLPPIDFRLLAAAFSTEAFAGAAFLTAALPGFPIAPSPLVS